MYHESRIKKTLLNARINTICYFLNLIIAFFSRKILIDHLGPDFLGLEGTLSSLLGFLNIAELGVGSAIGYLLYKPLYDGDKFKINEIISVFGYLYRWIGSAILTMGIIFSLFLPLVFPDTKFHMAIIIFAFYALLFSSLLGYFANYKSTLLNADQRGYEVTGYFQVVQMTMTITQMLFAYYYSSFVIFIALQIFFGIVYSVVLNWRVKKVYPWLDSEIRQGRKLLKKYPDISRYVKQIFVHKIGGFVQWQLTPMLIYGYVSLPIVALYQNYTTISDRVTSFLNGILDSTTAGVGNLISEGNRDKIYEIYKELLAFRIFVAGVISSCVYYLSSDFITIWLGEQYVLSSTVVVLVSIILFLNIARSVTEQFVNGYGLFYDIWSPIVEIIIFVASSILFGAKYGLPGVLMGPVVSTSLIIYTWKPYFLFTKGLKIPPYKYWIIFLTDLSFVFISLLTTTYIVGLLDIKPVLNWKSWIFEGAAFFFLMSVISFVLFFLFSQGMRGFVKRFLSSRKLIKE